MVSLSNHDEYTAGSANLASVIPANGGMHKPMSLAKPLDAVPGGLISLQH